MRIKSVLFKGQLYKEKSDTGNLLIVMEIFYVWSVIVVSWVGKTVKTHPIK